LRGLYDAQFPLQNVRQHAHLAEHDGNPLEGPVTPQSRGIRRSGIAAVIAVIVAFLFVAAAAQAAAAAHARTDDASTARLRSVADALSRSTGVTGTAWLVDPKAHAVVVLADRTVTGARLDRLAAAIRPYGAAVRVQGVAGTLGLRLSGGDPITGGGYRCTLGANVTGGGMYYFITAGHCGQAAATWYTLTGALIGSTVNSSFPGHDYALVRYTGSVTHEGTVGKQDITSAGSAYVGEHVCMRGGMTSVHCGTVLALNVTVNYAEGTVTGLIETNICAEAGDSGAPLYDGTKLIGTLSGGTGDCTSGGVTFFQPITQALSAYGLSVY
jgi:streptogrisin B